MNAIIATHQPCKICSHYVFLSLEGSFCDSIDDEVEPWWTGCCRWIARKDKSDKVSFPACRGDGCNQWGAAVRVRKQRRPLVGKTYTTYEDLVGATGQDGREKTDFAHGKMFNLPDWVKWWTASDTWGKANKAGDAKEHTVDIRVLGFVMNEPAFWPKGLRDRMGVLNCKFPFVHHRDADRTRHLCVKPFGRGGLLPGASVCPRCETFFDLRESTQGMDRTKAWDKMKAFSQKFSGLVFGYVDGDTSVVRAFEFADTLPGKEMKDPTFFDRVNALCYDNSVPAASRLDRVFYSYEKERAQIVRLKYKWIVPQADKAYWQLTDVFKVTAEDGAPSTEVPDTAIAERIRPWEWMDVEGEQKRMLESDGSASAPAKADFGKMSYAELAAYVVENQMSSVINLTLFDEDDAAELRAAIEKEVAK